MNFNTIPDDQTYLRPKKATTSNLKGRLVGAAVLSFVIACLARTGTTGASETSIQPVSFASEPAPAANEKPAPAAPAADQKAKPTCGRDANSPCSAQDFIDILDQEGWTARQPQPVDPNKNECASNPWGIGSDIQQGFKKVHSNEYESVGDGAPLDFPPGSCGSRVSWDPRVFGPHTWKTLHTFAVNYHSPPTEAAVDACTNFINALPYLIPCSHCAWDLGQFIQMNKDKNGLFDESCGGATGVPGSFDESLCLAPEEACKSQRTLVSFFVRAHNNVNQHTHPCRPRFTIKQGYDTYQEEYICAHSVVWGTKQLCGGGYSPAVDSPQGAVAGPKGTGRANGQDYYGVDVDEGCQPETALACGTIECKA